MTAIQFYGTDNVVKAFQYKKTPSWAIFQGRALIHKNETSDLEGSADQLQEFLNMLGDTSSAVYTLKVYEGKSPKINERTPCDGSFNFRLIEEDEREQRKMIYAGASNKVLAELEALRNEIAEMKAVDEDEDDEEPNTMNGIIAGLLNDPAKIPQLVEGVKSVFAMLAPKREQLPMQMPQRTPAISGITDDEKIKQAIERLAKQDPHIGDHLTKLADIAEQSKPTFDYLIKMLEQMQ